MAMTLDELVTQLRAAYGDRLVSMVLYGSAAGADHVPKKSDYNVLVLLDRFDAAALAAPSAAARAWSDAGNPPPMTMTVGEWRSSTDVFPMEYADILERHRVLYGTPPFEGLDISREHLRLQLEQQVMGKLLQLRQGALLAGTDAARQTSLIDASVSTIMVLFRAVLRLVGERPGTDNTAVISRVASLARLDAAPFLAAVAHHRGSARIAPGDAPRLLAQYLTGVETLGAYLDTFTNQERSS